MNMIENSKPKVTAIMAAYNTAPYVRRAVESVQKQTMAEWELWCIDDASTDDTAVLLDEIAQADHRIKVIHLEQNGGLGNARNIGIEKATGEYMCFIDSDDYIKDDYMKTLYDLAECTGSEEIYFGMEHEWEEALHRGKTVKKPYFGKKTEYTIYENGKKFLYDMIKNRSLSFAGCRQFFRTDLIRRSNLRFRQDILSEDVPFTVYALLACEKTCYLRRELYVYCHRWGSITLNLTGEKTVYSAYAIAWEFFQMWFNCREDAEVRETMAHLYKYLLSYCKNVYMRLSDEERESVRKRISEDPYGLDLFELIVEEKLHGNYVARIDSEKLEEIRTYPKIVIYGAGNYAVDLYLLLKKQFVNVLGFAVTECSQNVSAIDGKPVLAAEEWMQDKSDALIILGCDKSSEEKIVAHLDELGFDNVMSI